jgi:P pilus assembly chaperone PapD
MIRALWRSLACAALCFVCVCICVVSASDVAFAQPSSAQWQGRFNVTPTRLVLRPNETSTSLLLKNEAAEALRFQVTAFAWANAIDGEMKLEPTKDIVFFRRSRSRLARRGGCVSRRANARPPTSARIA